MKRWDASQMKKRIVAIFKIDKLAVAISKIDKLAVAISKIDKLAVAISKIDKLTRTRQRLLPLENYFLTYNSCQCIMNDYFYFMKKIMFCSKDLGSRFLNRFFYF